MKFKLSIIHLLTLMILLSACAMKQDVYLNETGGGRVVFDIMMADYITEVVDQLSVFMDEPLPEKGVPIFDIQAIENDFQDREGVDLVRIRSPVRNRLIGEFGFRDIELLLQEPINSQSGKPQRRLINLEKQKNGTSLKVRINRETVESILAENPSFNNPLIENFGPSATEDLSEADYLDMMEFALGTESRQGIKNSKLILTIHVTGKIINQKGGKLVDAKTVRFTIPMLSALMLNSPLEYSLLYR